MSSSTNTAKVPSPEKEIWKSPPSLGKRWIEVSNLGRVRTLDRYVDYVRRDTGSKTRVLRKGRIIKLGKDPRGRPIYSTGNGVSRLVKTLVAECFVPNESPSYNKFLFHRDGNRGNCRADNLYWGHSIACEICRGRKVGIFNYGVKRPVMVGSLTLIARQIGVSKQAIWRAIQDDRLCRGTRVRYVDAEVQAEEESPIPDELFADVKVRGKAVFRNAR